MVKEVATLIVYAYSSFTSSFGAGPAIVKQFEEKCSCKVVLVDAGDSGAMLNKLKLEGDKTKADVVVGVDGAHLYRLHKDLGWSVTAPRFDRAPLAFIYDSEKVKNPPTSLDDLLKPEWKGEIALQDPRLSTVGLGFLLWVIKVKGESGAWDYLGKLKPQLKLITPSWDLSYGLFKKGKVKLVLSFWTSPAYHIQEEKTSRFKAAAFKDGQYETQEFVAINPKSPNEKRAKEFVSYLMSKPSQKILAEKNFMYPETSVDLPEAFGKLGKAKVLDRVDPSEVELKLNEWLKQWRSIFS